MTNSLVPKPFDVTDAKRAREEEARKAERRDGAAWSGVIAETVAREEAVSGEATAREELAAETGAEAQATREQIVAEALARAEAFIVVDAKLDGVIADAGFLGSRLSAAESDLSAAAERLTDAESDLTDAFGQLDTVDSRVADAKAAAIADAKVKADAAQAAAINAAATAADSKVATAKAAALTEAATTAQQKADAAEAAALLAAKSYADTEASGAGADALAAAKLDATKKADDAKAAAITAASTAADSKVATAKAAALTEAAAAAQIKADKALADAKLDATAKAAQALVDAKADATTKANAAEAAAIQAAAQTAQVKADEVKVIADAAQAAAAEAYKSVTNMVVNGSFEQGWLGWTREGTGGSLDTTTGHDGTASFKTNSTGGAFQSRFPVRQGDTWRYSWWYKTEAGYVTGPGGLRLRAVREDGTQAGDVASSSLGENVNWTHQSLNYVVPAGITHLYPRFAFALGGSSKSIWVDSLKLENITEAKALTKAAEDAAAAAAAADALARAAQTAADAANAELATIPAKIETAKQAAIDAAALVAQAKANAAESNAKTAAATDAKTKADAAQAAAIAAAKTASDLSAAGAKSEAIAAATADAKTKADAAQAAAIAAAAADATAKAAQAKTDATTIAANDATTKANNAQAAAIAAAATDATAKAGQAKTDAIASATTMTNGIGKNLSSTAVPTTFNTAPQGSMWRRTDGSGRIIGVWEQTGAGVAGTWTPRLITSDTIDNLDVGKLSASGAVINTLVSQKIAAAVGVFLELDVGQLRVTGSSTMAEAVINKLWADVVRSRQISAEMLEAEMVLATKIIAGDPASTHAEMSPLGFKVFASPAGGGTPTEVVRLGVAATDDYFAITKGDSTIVASISQDGVIVGDQVNATSALWYKGDELQTILDRMPRGIVSAGYRDTSSTVNASYGNIIPYLRIEAVLYPGRIYKVWTSGIKLGLDAGTRVTVGIKYANNGNLATIGSNGLTETATDTDLEAPIVQELFAVGTQQQVSFMLYLQVLNSGQAGFRGSGSVPTRLVVEDAGPFTSQIGNGVHLNGTTPPPPAVNTYRKQYGSTGSMNYQGSNAQYQYDTGHMYQGLSPAGMGNTKSISIHPSMTADLSGATINYVRVYFNFTHWYYNAGGTARIGLHGHASIPGSFSGSGIAATSYGWPRPGARWVDLPSSTFAGFKSGAYKGVYLEGDGTYGTYGIADRPTIEIGYTK